MRTRDPWADALAEYVQALAAANRSPGTAKLYRDYVRRVARIHPDPWAVTTQDLIAFLAGPQWSASTRRSASAALQSFYRWAHGAGHTDDDPARSLPMVHVSKERKRWPAPELVVSQILDDARVPDRVVFMGELMALAGLRRAEVARVHGSHYDAATRRLTVLGKGSRVRRVPITDEALHERLAALGDEWAFPNGRGSHLLPNRVGELVSRALPGGWTAHTLRHRFATKSNESEPDLFALADVLGHASVQTTMLYVMVPDHRAEAVAAAAKRPGIAAPLPQAN
jgi:integrase